MNRPMRIACNVLAAVGALILALVVAAILVVQTPWFQNYVKRGIVTSIENSTGGRVEVGLFQFHWTRLRAVVGNLVVHGNEPSGAPPLARVARIQLDLRLFPSVQRWWSIAALGVTQPQANVIVYADGHTNIPAPRAKRASSGSPLEAVVDLAVGHFDISNGTLTFADQKYQLNVRGNDLRAQLAYNTVKQDYSGVIALQPLYVAAGRNTPVDFTIRVPLVLSRNRIEVNGASLISSGSTLTIDASVENLRNPSISASVNGRVALADLKAAANVPLRPGRNLPYALDLQAKATAAGGDIQISSLRATLGQSNLQASGSLNGGLDFASRLSLEQLAKLMNSSSAIAGPVAVNGVARLDDQHTLYLSNLRVGALGAELTGDVSLQRFSTFRARGDLRHLDLRAALAAGNLQSLPYEGVISGALDASGSLKAPILRQLNAHADMSIAPGSRGVPISGQFAASYNGASDSLAIQHSALRLPHTRLTIDGSPGKELNLALVTMNLDDLLAALPSADRPQVALRGGQASFTGTINGHLRSPRIAGRFAADRLTIEGRRFDRVVADAAISKNEATIQSGGITRDSMRARFFGTVGLHDWRPHPSEPLSIAASIQNGDLADLMAFAGRPTSGYSGQLAADLRIDGTLGNPRGSGTLTVTNGFVHGQPFDRAQAQVTLTDQLVTLPAAFIQSGPGRVNLTASYQHPRDSFTAGQLVANVQSTQLNLAQLAAVQNARPGAAGIVQLNAAIGGAISNSHFQLSSINGNFAVQGLRSEGQDFGNLTATAITSGNTLNYKLSSNFAGSDIRVSGDAQFAPDYPTTAHATLANLPIERALALAHRTDISVSGTLSGTANFTGTLANPQGSADLNLSRATLYGEPLDRITARVNYRPSSIDVPQLVLVSGPSHVDLTAQYNHAAGDLQSGILQFNIAPSQFDLARLKPLTDKAPGLAGHLQITASGAAEVRPADPRIQIQKINASVAATGLAARGKNLGDLGLTANTESGRLNIALNSNLAGAAIQAHGAVQLAAGYPTAAQLTFNNVTYQGLAPLLGTSAPAPENFEGAADGKASLDGPLADIQQLRGSFQLTRLQLSSKSSLFGAQSGTTTELLQNQGPISATVDRGVVRIQTARLTGPQTNIQATGSIPLTGQPMKVALNGNVDLAILHKLNRSITSSGQVVIAADLGGTLRHPALAGQIDLRNSSLDYANSPTGIWKANGVILLNGSNALIRNVTAESGGGKVTVTGAASMNGPLRFDLAAHAMRVRLQVQQGLAVQVSATLSATGTSANSTISGNVTLDQVYYGAKTDLASILALSAPPLAPAPPAAFTQNMHLDVRVRGSSALAVQSSLAENLQLNADLRVRGTMARPGILGRVDITEGSLVFFGTTYTVNTGTISFYSPFRIEPVLDLSLDTQAQGVDVVVKVSGPFDNMKLSYSSNPPLQFQEILALLATGTAPTSDPTLLANQPTVAPQNFQQMGESALVGAAVANPVSNQLQRVFGISQLKISPTFFTGSQLPQAQISLTQQITRNLTFTYVTGFNTANAQTIQAQWTFTPQWSAQAMRDYNGIVSVTLTYKMQLH